MLASISGPASSAAASSSTSGITVSPPVKQIEIGPGLLQAFTDVIVTNNSPYTYTAKINLYDFSALGENGGVSLDQAGSKFGLANWMSLPGGNSLTLAKGQSQDIKVVINNRSDLTPGGHYGAVVLTSTSQTSQSNNNVGFNQQVASLVFLNKTGGEVYGLQLSSISRDPLSGMPNDISLAFKSTGNVYVVPHGYVDVIDPKGKLIERGIINQQDTILMQGTTRQYVTLMQPVTNPNLKGKYKLMVHYRHDGQNGYSISTYEFLYKASNTAVITGVATVMLLLCAFVFYGRKRVRRNS